MQTAPMSDCEGGIARLCRKRRRVDSGIVEVLALTNVIAPVFPPCNSPDSPYRPPIAPRFALRKLISVRCDGTYTTVCSACVCVASIRIHDAQG